MIAPASSAPSVAVERDNSGAAVVRIGGDWRLRHGMPATAPVERAIEAAGARAIRLEAAVGRWDSSLVSFVLHLEEYCGAHQIAIERGALPDGLVRMIALAQAVPEKRDARAADSRSALLDRVGAAVLEKFAGFGDFMEFLGEASIALGRMCVGRARFRRSDLLEAIQDCGANALGIVTLISYLVGVILAFMGAIQLQQFGAAIYVADLVAIGMVREMGAMMTGIIMSGRTGAAFAARLGTMKVTQEIDALATMGIPPMEFLTAPRIVALVLMMPLLCLYADLVGILGGATVGFTMLNLSLNTYLRESSAAILTATLIGGLVKSVVYGVLIALAGCYEGFRCGNSSSAVGDAATRAVVESIVAIVVACGVFAVLFHILNI
jgi:phospholipid/cholesterol/gamma-HCH transport system permease protein